MQINSATQTRTEQTAQRRMPAPFRAPRANTPGARPSRMAAVAAGGALINPIAGLAFFLSRKPTPTGSDRTYAKFRA